MTALRAWFSTATVAMALLLPLAPAHADEGAALDFSRMAPGSTRTAEVTVTNPSTGLATVALGVRALNDDDAGCVQPEVRAGDTSCGADGGELSRWLEVAVSRDGDVLWSGPFADLQEARELPGSLRPGESQDFDITVGLPLEAGNDTMTDRVSFDLVIRMVGQTGGDVGEPEVLGAQASTGQHDQHAISVPTIIEAGIALPAAAGGVLTDNWPEACFAVLLLIALGLTVRAVRRGRSR
jgi:hypothetical protein